MKPDALFWLVIASISLLMAMLSATAADLPNVPGALNPAVTQANIKRTVCVPGWTKTVRPPASYTNALKLKQMAEQGLIGNPRLWEEDHRVPLAAGGNPTDPNNLWPQHWSAPMGAHQKDRLENFVHRSICSGKMTLDQGRKIFLGDWTEAYIRIFGQPK